MKTAIENRRGTDGRQEMKGWKTGYIRMKDMNGRDERQESRDGRQMQGWKVGEGLIEAQKHGWKTGKKREEREDRDGKQ